MHPKKGFIVMFNSWQFRVFTLFITIVLYIISFLCYNSICKMWGKCGYEHLRYNIISIMFLPPIWTAFFIVSTAYFPYADGVPCLLKQYKFLWCWYLSGREYRQALQCLFQFRKTHGRTGGAGYAETPSQGSHLLLRTRLSLPARCWYGLSACLFV